MGPRGPWRSAAEIEAVIEEPRSIVDSCNSAAANVVSAVAGSVLQHHHRPADQVNLTWHGLLHRPDDQVLKGADLY